MRIVEIEESSDRMFDNIGLYRGVSIAEARIILQQMSMLPSTDLMPLDYEVVEYSIGDSIDEMSDEEIEDVVQSICPWYNGSINSIKGGLNLTTDWENASGYAGSGVIFGVNCDNTELAYFSDVHVFAKVATLCVPVLGMYNEQVMSIKQLKKLFNKTT